MRYRSSPFIRFFRSATKWLTPRATRSGSECLTQAWSVWFYSTRPWHSSDFSNLARSRKAASHWTSPKNHSARQLVNRFPVSAWPCIHLGERFWLLNIGSPDFPTDIECLERSITMIAFSVDRWWVNLTMNYRSTFTRYQYVSHEHSRKLFVGYRLLYR